MSKSKATHDASWHEKASGKSQPTHEAGWLERMSGKSQPTHEAGWMERMSGKSQPTHEAGRLERSFGGGSTARGGRSSSRRSSGSDSHDSHAGVSDWGDSGAQSSSGGCVKWVVALVVIAGVLYGVFSLSEMPAPRTQPAAVAPAAEANPQVNQPSLPTLVPTVLAPSANGIVNTAKLNVRKGPSTDYAIIIQITAGTEVALLGREPDGAWWLVQLADGAVGWVHGRYIDRVGCDECVPLATVAPSAVEMPVSAPATTATAPSYHVTASNRSTFNSVQGSQGWKYLMESARNSGVWQEMAFDGSCYRTGTWENDVRICPNGEVHPGMSTRIAYEWRPSEPGKVVVNTHAHKIDTSCGDGVWVGTYHMRDGVGTVAKLGEFLVGAADNVGKTETYEATLDLADMLYVIVDVHGESTCDLSRVYLDLKQP